ncbi:hypothetical protein HJ107_20700 [Vibrio parahaemolyticus]|nr:hypothetical protein [Vibrio parahaemolyticus]MBE4089233.1 hypothetical protein [Vibrio parahaemolyticus]
MNSALLSILSGQNNLELGKLTPSMTAIAMCVPTFAVVGLLSLISIA